MTPHPDENRMKQIARNVAMVNREYFGYYLMGIFLQIGERLCQISIKCRFQTGTPFRSAVDGLQEGVVIAPDIN